MKYSFKGIVDVGRYLVLKEFWDNYKCNITYKNFLDYIYGLYCPFSWVTPIHYLSRVLNLEEEMFNCGNLPKRMAEEWVYLFISVLESSNGEAFYWGCENSTPYLIGKYLKDNKLPHLDFMSKV